MYWDKKNKKIKRTYLYVLSYRFDKSIQRLAEQFFKMLTVQTLFLFKLGNFNFFEIIIYPY